MNNLTGDKVIEYFSFLEKQIDNCLKKYNKTSLAYDMHNQMKKVVSAETRLIKKMSEEGEYLFVSLSDHGLPSANCINGALDTICELAKNDDHYSELAQTYQEGVHKLQSIGTNGSYRLPKKQEEFDPFEKYDASSGEKKSSFEISENEKGMIVLQYIQGVYVDGYDMHSKEFPAIIREGEITYCLMWNNLVCDVKGKLLVPQDPFQKETKAREKIFEDITRQFGFKKNDYSKEGRKGIGWRSKLPDDYSKFIASGTNVRVSATTTILDELGQIYKQKVVIEGIKTDKLKEFLEFNYVPFKNDPKKSPNHNEIKKINEDLTLGLILGDGRQIGQISYAPPHFTIQMDMYSGEKTHFNLDNITITIKGSEIDNGEIRDSLLKTLDERI